ncbi:uncharacterized protein [Henckelia pumila]|uniref:uncharacterized protein n=1 Tax=Henckelia pumila TaxID=405737 RepID=UPI003C6E5BA3
MTVFTVVEAPSSYNVNLGRPTMNAFKSIASTYHQKIKYPVGRRVGEVTRDQPSSQKCYMEIVKIEAKRTRVRGKETMYRPRGKKINCIQAEEIHAVLTGEQEERNVVVFSWGPLQLTSISPAVEEHKLNVVSGARVVKQKKRHFGPEKDKVIVEQVQALLTAGHIREVQYPTWLSNVVLVSKGHGKFYSGVRITMFHGCVPGIPSDTIGTGRSRESQLCYDGRYGMRLNPAKCTFDIKGGKFLGYIVTERGIEVNPEKVRAIQEMALPKSIRDVQRLRGRIAALSRFISRSVHRSYDFFRVLRKAGKFEWNKQCEKDFAELKDHLADLPILVKPSPRERLCVYLSTTNHVVSLVLVKQEGTDRQPVYYVSHALFGPKAQYTKAEKVALALITTARRLIPYFLSHPITVLMNSVVVRIMTQPDISGRLVKWTIELEEYDIDYQPRTAVKAQASSDFIAEMTPGYANEVWKVYVDGASIKKRSGVEAVFISSTGEKIKLAVKLDFRASNNEAKYEAVLVGLRATKEMEVDRVIVYSDSQLATQQVMGTYEIKMKGW